MARDLFIKFVLPFALFGYAGWWFAAKMIALPHLQTFKVLNVIAILFDIAGVAVLSHFVISKPRAQMFIAGPVAEAAMAFLVASHVGMVLCAEFGPDGPSRTRMSHIAYPIAFYVVGGIVFVIGNLTDSRIRSLLSTETRATVLGIFFLFGGLIIHLIAAVMDLSAG